MQYWIYQIGGKHFCSEACVRRVSAVMLPHKERIGESLATRLECYGCGRTLDMGLMAGVMSAHNDEGI